jgi:solute carrier family 13 (sodium-dependent dicarboxylate transporter), member 2/3/5
LLGHLALIRVAPGDAMEKLGKALAVHQKIGLLLGPLLAVAVFLAGPPEGLMVEGWRVVGLAFWMAAWWATEAVPVAATALLPLVYLPLFGVLRLDAAATPYAGSIIFLLLGGFIIAMALQRWNLHRRIALNVLRRFDASPSALVAGFMIASAVMSMWVSNTATTLMMVPIALSVAEAVSCPGNEKRRFIVALLLGVAYAASIGGFGTLIGTPPNAMAAAFLKQSRGIDISFVQWMGLGVPMIFLLLPLAWLTLTRIAFPLKGLQVEGGKVHVEKALSALGPLSAPERRTAWMLAVVAASWIARPLLNDLPALARLDDTMIAIAGAIAMFVIPSGSQKEKGSFLLNWEWAVKIPWGVLLLFGGGLSLAYAIDVTGLATWLGHGLSALAALHPFFLLLSIVSLIVFLTELTSNTATTAALLPILGAIAAISGSDPIMLEAPAALAASCAFMLPVATGPNAIVFASGQVTIPDMVRAGFVLNLFSIAVIAGLGYLLVPLVFG